MIENTSICLKCPHVSPPPYLGVANCLHDREKPVNIVERVQSGHCPLMYFSHLPEPITNDHAVPSIPYGQWPDEAKAIAVDRDERDKGLGDTVQRKLDGIGGVIFKAAMEWLKTPCGCTDRQAWLNAKYPY